MGENRNQGKGGPAGAGLRDVSGATAVEYGLIGAGIALAIIVAIFAIGDDLVSLFGTVQSALAEDR